MFGTQGLRFQRFRVQGVRFRVSVSGAGSLGFLSDSLDLGDEVRVVLGYSELGV